MADDEYFDLVDEENHPTGKKATRSACHSDPRLIHRDVHILVRNSQNKLYLKRRSETRQLYAGCWESSVSGHVLSGESYDQAAVREREEETGITGIPLEKICEFKNFSVIESQWTGLYTCTYDGHIRLNEEATEGRWYTLDELTEALEKRTLTLSPGTRLSLQEYFRRRAT